MAHIVFQNNLLIADYNVLSMQNMAKYSNEDFFFARNIKVSSISSNLANAHMPCRKWMSLIVIVATCVFLWIIVTENYTQQVTAQQYWVSFETAAFCGERERSFFNNGLETSACVSFVETTEHYIH